MALGLTQPAKVTAITRDNFLMKGEAFKAGWKNMIYIAYAAL